MNMLRVVTSFFMVLVVMWGTKLSAHALEAEPFTKTRFDLLQAQGAPILVDVFAPWCPTCAKQREVFATYQRENPDTKLVILEVHFDDQKEWVKYFKAPRQSTLVLFNGRERVWFSVAETRKEKIYSAFEELLGK